VSDEPQQVVRSIYAQSVRDLPPGSQANIGAALDSVKPGARGLPVAEVEARLTHALREHGAFLPPDDIRFIARILADPWWPLKRPVVAFRETRRRRRPTVDPNWIRLEDETAYLDTRLEHVLEIVQRRSRRTVDGIVHDVVISPWSAEIAAQIHQLAAPIRVNVSGFSGTNPEPPTGHTP